MSDQTSPIYDRDYLYPTRHLKATVRKRFNGRCLYCGEPHQFLTVDHVIPVVNGGTTELSNLVPACGTCNQAKGDKEVLSWWMLQPFWNPGRAQILYLIVTSKNNYTDLLSS